MAILSGTTADGQTLPVLVDQFGNLLAKGIKGDPGNDGQDGAKGEPGAVGEPGPKGDTGVGLPLPYGEDGSYLTLIEGEPAWTDVPGPDPEPPSDHVEWTNYETMGVLYSVDGLVVHPSDPIAYGKAQPCWLDNTYQQKIGWNLGLNGLGDANTDNLLKLAFDDSTFGKILRVLIELDMQMSVGGFPGSLDVSFTSHTDNVNVISPPSQLAQPGTAIPYWGAIQAEFLFNNDVRSLDISWRYEPGFSKINTSFMRGWEWVDPGEYAFQEQQRIKSEMTALRAEITELRQSRD